MARPWCSARLPSWSATCPPAPGQGRCREQHWQQEQQEQQEWQEGRALALLALDRHHLPSLRAMARRRRRRQRLAGPCLPRRRCP